MPTFSPFSGLRYDASRVALDDVVCPPYDVIDAGQLAALEARSPFNSVRVELPREGYEAAAARFGEWEADGVLVRERTPALYAYRMSFTDDSPRPRSTFGFIGALGGVGILRHERTTAKDKADRLSLLRATRVNTSPIWGLSLARGLSDAWSPDGTADLAARDAEGVLHEVWVLRDAETSDRIAAIVGSHPVVVADGHHRYETSLAYSEEGGGPGSRALMAYVVQLAEEQLWVRPTHRVVSGITDDGGLLAALESRYTVSRVEAAGADLAGEPPLVVSRRGSWRLVPHDSNSIDSELVDAALPGGAAVTYTHDGHDAIQSALDTADCVAILVRAVTVEQIAATARAGEQMPQKTTYFAPKPRTGMVFRPLD